MGIGRWIGATLAAVAAMLFYYYKTADDPAKEKAVESLVSLAVMDQQTVVPEFTTAASGKYLIELEFQTPSPATPGQAAPGQVKNAPAATSNSLLGCMAGVLKGPPDCKDQRDLLDVTWSVASAGQMVAVGASGDFEGQGSIDDPNNKMTRLIGRFPAHKGDAYSLRLNLHTAPPTLAARGAKLLVRPEINN
jgi:hypothetical protein